MTFTFTPSLVARLNTLIENENRKRKKDLFLVSSEELNHHLEQLIYLIKINMVYEVPDLHVHLSNHVNRFSSIIHVLQDNDLSLDKHDLTNWQSSWTALKDWMKEHESEIQESFQEAWESIPYHDLYPLSSYALRSVDYYFNHLLSKVVDYFPKGRSLSPLADLINVFVENQSRLEQFIELGLHWWVYIFTENTRYVPYTFKQLNGVEGLGKQIETWVKPTNNDPVIELVKEAGYNQVFAGWGGIHLEGLSADERTTTPSKVSKVAEPSKEEKHFVIPKKNYQQWITQVAQHLRATLAPYVDNPQTIPTNTAHVTMVMRVMATTIMYFTGGKPLLRGDFNQVLTSLKSIFKKHDGFMRRKDRREWFIESWIRPTNIAIEEMVSQVNAVPTLIIQQIFNSVTLPYRLRLATNEEKKAHFSQMMTKLLTFLDSSHHEVYYSDKFTYDELAIGNILVLYTQYLAPRYINMIDDNNEGVFISGLEYWLDIYNPTSVKMIMDCIRTHFEKRRSIEENEKLMDCLRNYVLLLSQRNKPLLEEELNKILEEIPNYGKSHQVITDLITMNQQEMERLSTRQPAKYVIAVTDEKEGKVSYTVDGRDMYDIYNEIDKQRPSFKVKDVSI